MANIIFKILNQIKPYLLICGTIISAIVASFVYGHSQGEEAVKHEAEKETLSNVKSQQEITQRVDHMPTAAIDEQLRNKWLRK